MLYRKIATLTLVLSFVMLFCQPVLAANWSDPVNVNKILTRFDPPTLTPAAFGYLSLRLSNPFSVEISNVSILAEPYLFVQQDGTAQWEDLTHLPTMRNASTNSGIINISHLLPNENLTLNWRIDTDSSTPRGSWMAQPVYLVRLLIRFDDGRDNVSYASRGFFSDDEWTRLRTIGDPSVGGVNQTYLLSLGFNGIIPETSFTVKDEIPLWPVFMIGVVAAFSFTYAVYLYSKKKPGIADRLVFIISRLNLTLKGLIKKVKK